MHTSLSSHEDHGFDNLLRYRGICSICCWDPPHTTDPHVEIFLSGTNVASPPHGISRANDTLRHDPMRSDTHIDHPEGVHAGPVDVPDEYGAPAKHPSLVFWQREVNVRRRSETKGLLRHWIRVSQDNIIDDELAVFRICRLQSEAIGIETTHRVFGRYFDASGGIRRRHNQV